MKQGKTDQSLPPKNCSAGFCEITHADIMRLDSLSMQHKPLLQVAISKGAPYSGGPILPELHPDYTYTQHDLSDGTTCFHWEPNAQDDSPASAS